VRSARARETRSSRIGGDNRGAGCDGGFIDRGIFPILGQADDDRATGTRNVGSQLVLRGIGVERGQTAAGAQYAQQHRNKVRAVAKQNANARALPDSGLGQNFVELFGGFPEFRPALPLTVEFEFRGVRINLEDASDKLRQLRHEQPIDF
jgi:hypothetical protein